MRAPIRAVTAAATELFAGAERLAPAQLPQALALCAAELQARFGLSVHEAHDMAMVGFCEASGKASGCYVDLAQSSRHLVVIVDTRAGLQRAIPLLDLLRILGPIAVPPPAS